MPKFRKKPVEVEAWCFDPWNSETPNFLREAFKRGRAYYQGGDEPYITIETMEGRMRADVGDWIIRDVKGDLYPCKTDIFAATYDPVEGT